MNRGDRGYLRQKKNKKKIMIPIVYMKKKQLFPLFKSLLKFCFFVSQNLLQFIYNEFFFRNTEKAQGFHYNWFLRNFVCVLWEKL